MKKSEKNMLVHGLSQGELDGYYAIFSERARKSSPIGKPCMTKCIDLGSHKIKLENYCPEFSYYFIKHLEYSLRDNVDKYDATIVVYREKNFREMLSLDAKKLDYLTIFKDTNDIKPLISMSFKDCFLKARDIKKNIYYFALESIEYDDIARYGHSFVHEINGILKTPDVALVHGAVVGINNKGVLICGRGGKGKSTLTVSSLLDDFQYVSDDYLILQQENGKLYASPIYSIITLSPEMHDELKDLKTEFVSNNWNKSKYVLSIAGYHNKFVKKMPIEALMFPQIVDDKVPTVESVQKGKAITQMVHSTVSQMEEQYDIKAIQRLTGFIKNLDCYQINLTRNLKSNLKELKSFISGL
jgi:hypothetical protein